MELELENFRIIFLLLLLFIAALGALAQRLKTPYPIVLVIGGLIISLFPHLPHVVLHPDYIFLIILPPLLYFAAFETSWRDFIRNITPISMLAVGLVAFTTVGVGLAAHWLLPGFDWRLGLTLGAILSPTDALAATSIAKRLGLPARIIDILEGESMVNDATGLVALRFAVAIVVSGVVPGIGQTSATLLYLITVGIIAGLVVGALTHWFERWVDNAPIEITLSIVTPYFAYIAAEELHASGVLAVVACGLYLGRHSSLYLSSEVRLQSWSTWNTLSFILNGLVFLLIGLQLRPILAAIRGISRAELATTATITVALVIGLRLLWVFPAAALSNWFARKVQKVSDAPYSRRGVFVVGWTGMRGVLSLAAALSLPATLESGKPFPQREAIIFITFCVIFVTLVLQGLTLPALIRALKIADDGSASEEEALGRRRMVKAALLEVEKLRQNDPEEDPLYASLAEAYRRRLDYVKSLPRKDGDPASEFIKFRTVSADLRAVERKTIVQLRDEYQISDAVLRKLERELDLLDTRYPRA